jgi:hypothetical protein
VPLPAKNSATTTISPATELHTPPPSVPLLRASLQSPYSLCSPASSRFGEFAVGPRRWHRLGGIRKGCCRGTHSCGTTSSNSKFPLLCSSRQTPKDTKDVCPRSRCRNHPVENWFRTVYYLTSGQPTSRVFLSTLPQLIRQKRWRG